MTKPRADEPRKKHGDKFETLIDKAASDESEAKRRKATPIDDERDSGDVDEADAEK
jgi:hypothetical protein